MLRNTLLCCVEIALRTVPILYNLVIVFCYSAIPNWLYPKTRMSSMDAIARRVTLRELRLLLAVARCGSILKAAQDIGLTQPAVSKSVADLEGVLGVRLFDRTNRGVEPTPHGRVVLLRAAGVFDELRQAVEELAFLSDSSGGELRIGGTPAMCGGLLSHAISAIESERPGVQFHVIELESEKLVGEVRARAIDVGLARAPTLGLADDIAFDPLFDDRLFVVAGASHPLARRRSISLEEVADQRWVLPMPQSPVSQQFRSAFERLELRLPQSVVTSMSLLVRYELLATNRFVTVLHGSLLQFGNMPSHVRVLPIELSAGILIGLIKVKDRTVAPVAELFMERMREIVEPMRSLSAHKLQRAMHSRSPNGKA